MPEQPSAELKTEACTVAAKATIEAMNNDQTSTKRRIRAIGDYMLCCTMACDEDDIKEWEQRCTQGLASVGASEEVVETLHQKYIKKRNVQRIVFSLSYLSDEVIPGIFKDRKKTILADEIAFLHGVIERAKEGGVA